MLEMKVLFYNISKGHFSWSKIYLTFKTIIAQNIWSFQMDNVIR